MGFPGSEKVNWVEEMKRIQVENKGIIERLNAQNRHIDIVLDKNESDEQEKKFLDSLFKAQRPCDPDKPFLVFPAPQCCCPRCKA